MYCKNQGLKLLIKVLDVFIQLSIGFKLRISARIQKKLYRLYMQGDFPDFGVTRLHGYPHARHFEFVVLAPPAGISNTIQ